MYISEHCATCLYNKQASKTNNEAYLKEVKRILDERREEDCAPYMVYRFANLYEEYFHERVSYAEEKKLFNDLALSMEGACEALIEANEDPLKAAILYARVGNYIDFGAMNHVDQNTFLKLFDGVIMSESDEKTYASFVKQCEVAKEFLLLTDNCGEIVFDKLLVRQLKKRFPQLNITVMVRGDEVLNDATLEDAYYVGMNQEAKVIDNGTAVAGTIYEMICDDAKDAFDKADVILSKGQGNYESLAKRGYHIFYAFLCKCDLFEQRFNVPRLTGMFVEETE